MKRILFVLTVIFHLNTVTKSQQFAFQMYFTDFKGNKDTITFGVDSLATDSIDLSFGENNIINFPLDPDFDVRVSNEWVNRRSFSKPGTFHSKKQITYYNCPFFTKENIITIDIYTKNWPVTATWNNLLFLDSCVNGSVLTSIIPNGWWDTGSPSNLDAEILSKHNSVTFTSQVKKTFNENYSYLKSFDTIPVFWVAIGGLSIFNTAVDNKSKTTNKLSLYPNPTSGKLFLEIPEEFGQIQTIQIFSTLGQLISKPRGINEIDFSHLEQGFYLLKITNKYGNSLIAHVLKTNDH